MLETQSSITRSVTYKEFLTDKFHLYFDEIEGDVTFHRLGTQDFYLVRNKNISNNTLQFFINQNQRDVNEKIQRTLNVFCISKINPSRKMTML